MPIDVTGWSTVLTASLKARKDGMLLSSWLIHAVTHTKSFNFASLSKVFWLNIFSASISRFVLSGNEGLSLVGRFAG